jgi:predicted MFS family arabinose efflux permease
LLLYLKNSFSGLSPRIWLLFIINLINRSGGMVICFLTLYLTESLHFSLTAAGYAMSFYGLGSVVGQFSGGRLTDTIGYQRTQMIALLGNGLCFFSLLFVESFWVMCVALFVCNAFGEAFRPANSIAVRMNSTPETLTRSFSLLRLAYNLAITIALVGGGFLIAQGWHFIFWVDALTCFAAAAALYFLIPEVKKATVLPKNTNENTENDALKLAVKPAISPYKDGYFLAFIGLTFLCALVFLQILFTVPPFFKNVYHWDEKMIGIVCAVNGVIVMLVEVPLVFGIEKKRSKLWFIILGILLYAISYAVFLLPVSFKWFSALFYMVIISFGEIFVMPFSTNWAMSRAAESNQGQYIALYGTAYSVSIIVAPIIGTQIIDGYGYDALWIFITVVALFTAAGFGVLRHFVNKI